MIGWIEHLTETNSGYREELWRRDRKFYWFIFGKPQFDRERALKYLKLGDVDPDIADQKCNLWGHRIYIDSKRPAGEQVLDHGVVGKTCRAWRALGS